MKVFLQLESTVKNVNASRVSVTLIDAADGDTNLDFSPWEVVPWGGYSYGRLFLREIVPRGRLFLREVFPSGGCS